jgi:pSer/pThr/pTyr-binding forkhead associated (FHA) protein
MIFPLFTIIDKESVEMARERAVLTIRTPDGEGYDVVIDQMTFTVGRRATCDLQLPNSAVSGLHARFELDSSGTARVIDLGSKNGTAVDGMRIEPNVPALLKAGSEVTIANVALVLSDGVEGDSMSLSLEQSESLSRSFLRGMLGVAARGNRATLQVLKGPAKGTLFSIDERRSRVLIGTGEGVDLEVGVPALAGKPVTLLMNEQSYQLLPHGEAKLQVGSEPVEQPRRLRDGDTIRILKSTIRFRDPLQSAIDGLDEDGEPPVPTLAEAPAAPRVGWTKLEIGLMIFGLVSLTGAALFLLMVFGVI